MRRTTAWIGAFLVAALAGGGGVVALNATVLGPGDFVHVYLDALARGDAEGALAFPGVTAGDLDPSLLRDDVLTGLSDIRQVSDEALGEDRHRITMSWNSPGGDGTSAFEVVPTGTRLGLFPEWGFAVSPVAELALEVEHDPRYTANGVPASTARTAEGIAAIAVFVPGSYVLGHDTAYLRADAVTVLADQPQGTVDAVVEVRPAPAFAPAVASAVGAALDACTAQHVLYPTGCPFGETITDRVASEPQWTIVHHPELDLEPGPFGTWIAGPAPGTAHLEVEVQSLFDGSLSTFDQDVPFQAHYSVRFDGDGIAVTAIEPAS
jgi:hypothetical protein